MCGSANLTFDFFRGIRVVFLDQLTVTAYIGDVGETVGLARKALWVSHSFVGDSGNRVYATVNQMRFKRGEAIWISEQYAYRYRGACSIC